MKLVFDANFFAHVNAAAIAEHGRASRAMTFAEALLRKQWFAFALALFERSVTFLLTLPIPLYSGLVYQIVTHMQGLPHFAGMYLRALYYRGRLGGMEPNVLIDQGVFFAHPKAVDLKEFSYIDKGTLIMSRSAKVGRRVHIAPNVFISGGGDFVAEDYSCVATGAKIITSTEVMKNGARCSGPMISPDQRNVLRGKVILRKDCFIGAGAILLPNTEIGEGSVVGGGATIARSTEAWAIYANERARIIGHRDRVIHPDT